MQQRSALEMTFVFLSLAVPVLTTAEPDGPGQTTEFCLQGEFDLGVRLQGMRPEVSERYPTRFCVVTEDDGNRVHFSASGNSNPDMEGDFAVSYLPPDTVRLVLREAPADIEFAGKAVIDETRRYYRLDPRRLVAEIDAHPDWVESKRSDGWLRMRYPGSPFAARIFVTDDRLQELRTFANMPMRGRAEIIWRWDWSDADNPAVDQLIDGTNVFSARGSWRTLSAAEASAFWRPTGDEPPRQIPGDRWPASVDMQLRQLAERVYAVDGVRTGFSHIVIDTEQGLIVGDAPAGWIELPQIPPADLVPGLGVSGLSQSLIDFLREQFPDSAFRAVALTHVHDDHAGGARAFAAAGADIYAPAGIVDYLEKAFNRPTMPLDALPTQAPRVTVIPVSARLLLEDAAQPVELLETGPGPHVEHSLGLLDLKSGYFFQSDLHVPNADTDVPRSDRTATECWFARWAVDTLPDNAMVINTHSNFETPLVRLHRYMDSEACSAGETPSR